MEEIVTPLVPLIPRYYDLPGPRKLDYPAICCFAAIGFFLDEDTFFTNRKAFRPATKYQFDEKGGKISQKKYFEWHYTPRDITFEETLKEFSRLMEMIVQRDCAGKRIIVPISGGLDSRVLAAVVKENKDTFAYSYEFQDGVPENVFGRAVARAAGFEHEGFIIPRGYLWKVITDLATINGCYAEFTNPRQMAIWRQLDNRGDVFLLGHGGDLFFDGMGVPDEMSFDDQVKYLVKKLIKPAGWELGQALWNTWNIQGDFKSYLVSRIKDLHASISIDNANAHLRAFKTEFYVSRWTVVNLEIFQRQKPIVVPFFDDEICRFICSVPEHHLADRKLEIAYLKTKAPALAAIAWQKYNPCNLYNYELFGSYPILAKRAVNKAGRLVRKYIFGKKSDARNWELQFSGRANDEKLRSFLFEPDFARFVSPDVVEKVYFDFKKSPFDQVHAMSMLLTLSVFNKLFFQKGDE